jgi:hypothetical protein
MTSAGFISYGRKMLEPNHKQLKTLYRICYFLTNVVFHPIHIIRVDEQSHYIFVLAGHEEDIEVEIRLDGSIDS